MVVVSGAGNFSSAKANRTASYALTEGTTVYPLEALSKSLTSTPALETSFSPLKANTFILFKTGIPL